MRRTPSGRLNDAPAAPRRHVKRPLYPSLVGFGAIALAACGGSVEASPAGGFHPNFTEAGGAGGQAGTGASAGTGGSQYQPTGTGGSSFEPSVTGGAGGVGGEDWQPTGAGAAGMAGWPAEGGVAPPPYGGAGAGGDVGEGGSAGTAGAGGDPLPAGVPPMPFAGAGGDDP